LRADADGALLANFEHPLIVTGGTDCSLGIAWKDPILEAGELRGFELLCSVRSQSEGPSTFQVAVADHPSLKVSAIAPIALAPGQVGDVVVPLRWDRSIKDDQGFNHPIILELSVGVSNGRRTSRLRWESIANKLEPFLHANGQLKNGQAPPQPRPAPPRPITRAARMPQIPLLMLNGHSEPLRLPSPPGVKPVWIATASAAVVEPKETIELSLFPGLADMPPASSANGKVQGAQQIAPQAPAQVSAPAVSPTLPPAAKEEPAAAAVETRLTAPAQPQAPAAPSKLTPYAPAKWDQVQDDDFIPTPTTAAASTGVVEKPSSPPTPAFVAAQLTRQRQVSAKMPGRRQLPAGLTIGVLAVAALAVAAILFKPTSSTQPQSTAPVAVATPIVAANAVAPEQHVATQMAHHAVVKHVALSPKPQPTLAPTPKAIATPSAAPATPKPATPKPVAQHVAVQRTVPTHPGPVHPFRHIKLYQPESGPVVALGGIEAYYGPRGRAVRVIWSSAEQASASVQLIDGQGATVNSINVRGARQSVILYLPRGYHGPLTVQVSSIGKLGERVAQTTSLPAFGN
jgi:hypothetical protein